MKMLSLAHTDNSCLTNVIHMHTVYGYVCIDLVHVLYVCINALQDLITVKFTPIADRDGKTSLIAKGVSFRSYIYIIAFLYVIMCCYRYVICVQ